MLAKPPGVLVKILEEAKWNFRYIHIKRPHYVHMIKRPIKVSE
jgi:hypothetical protein